MFIVFLHLIKDIFARITRTDPVIELQWRELFKPNPLMYISEGNFHRKKKESDFDPFKLDASIIPYVNKNIRLLNKTLIEYQFSSLPETYLK